jgi:probable F420-dependent oxidoreductase
VSGLRIGIHLPQYGRVASGDAITRAARLAEERGFADVWVSDHVVHPAAQDYPSAYLFDPLLALTWAASATTEVGLGTSVLVVPQHHPLWLANATASLDALSGGRLTLGVGAGWSEAEFDALDQSFHDRGRRMDEALEIIQACWTTDPTSFAGEFYEFHDIRVQPKPAHPIDIWVGGQGAAALRRAARFGAGFQLIGLDEDSVAAPVAELRSHHPDTGSFTISLRTGWDPQGMEPDRIRRERDAFVAAGVQHIVSAPWRSGIDDWLRSMELLADLVDLEPR